MILVTQIITKFAIDKSIKSLSKMALHHATVPKPPLTSLTYKRSRYFVCFSNYEKNKTIYCGYNISLWSHGSSKSVCLQVLHYP